ncbi:hypothetical protein A3711_15790 [Erythrobacter sp. HI00D59]|nr:hypothetical protein A3711_15790 [Erythrobacter sp. HI00D59]
MLGEGFLDWLREQDDRTKTGLIGQLEERERALIRHDWPLWRREAQSPPRGAWNCWVICAGRGFGKTRTGAEWVRECAILDPDARIALVAASLGEARSVMVEGESGVLAICPPNYRPFYEPSLKRLTWPNGAMAFLYSAAEPESLRGPQHSHAWCAGPERGVCQRRPLSDRRVAPSRGQRQHNRAAVEPAGRRVLGRCSDRFRCMVRAGGDAGMLGWRAMDLLPAPGRNACLQRG